MKENRQTRTTFHDLLTAWEADPRDGGKLTDLAQAVAASVLAKVSDPQRKTAPARDRVSDGGQDPAILSMRRGLAADRAALDNLTAATNAATVWTYDSDGRITTETADPAAAERAAALQGQTLTDGADLMQTAAVALLEQYTAAAERGDTDPGWTERLYTVRRLARRVYTDPAAPRQYKDVDTTPVQEAFRAVRRAVEAARAVKTDPASAYTYVADGDDMDRVYIRSARYADIGGYETDLYGRATGRYTADRDSAARAARALSALDLTARQGDIIRRRLQGASVADIARALNVTERAVRKTLTAVQGKAVAVGLAPADWTAPARDSAARAVIGTDPATGTATRYDSAAAAATATGTDAGSIRAAAKGKRDSAGGLLWTYAD